MKALSERRIHFFDKEVPAAMAVKMALCLLLGLALAPATYSQGKGANRPSWSTLVPESIRKTEMKKEREETIFEIQALQKAKWAILNGQLEKAQNQLKKMNSYNSTTEPLKNYYLSLIDFLQRDYDQSLQRLTKNIYQRPSFYRQSCLFTSLLQMIQNPPLKQKRDKRSPKTLNEHREQLAENLEKCQFVTSDYSANDQYWYQTLEKISFGEEGFLRGESLSDIKYILSKPEMVRIWLKTGLYTNNLQLIEPHLESLPGDLYRLPRFRELLGFYFYRTGEEDKAKDFIENLNTANSHNIRGNIELSNDKLELAFGHFQLALKEKSNSHNALIRAIPLAWMLEQWEDGREMLTKMIDPNYDKFQKLSLNTAFDIQLGKLDYAEAGLKELRRHYQEETPLIVNLMASYVALRKHRQAEYLNFAEKSCRSHDGLSCWFLLENLVWNDLSKTIEREGPVWEEEINIDDMKTWRETRPLEEETYVDQSDIEELDTQEVNLPFKDFQLLDEASDLE